jgi:hypothetical protein
MELICQRKFVGVSLNVMASHTVEQRRQSFWYVETSCNPHDSQHSTSRGIWFSSEKTGGVDFDFDLSATHFLYSIRLFFFSRLRVTQIFRIQSRFFLVQSTANRLRKINMPQNHMIHTTPLLFARFCAQDFVRSSQTISTLMSKPTVSTLRSLQVEVSLAF